MLLPLGPRVAAARHLGERVLPSGVVLPFADRRFSHEGTVLAVGEPHRVGDARLPLDVAVGDRILYSSRVDSFETDEGMLDIVEENSIIGRLP